MSKGPRDMTPQQVALVRQRSAPAGSQRMATPPVTSGQSVSAKQQPGKADKPSGGLANETGCITAHKILAA